MHVRDLYIHAAMATSNQPFTFLFSTRDIVLTRLQARGMPSLIPNILVGEMLVN